MHLSDAAMAVLFQTHVSICINSANLVWQRFSIMVIANSIIFSFLTNKQGGVVIFGTFFGFFLCALWYLLIAEKWSFFQRWMALSRRFIFPTLEEEANPHRHIKQRPLKNAGKAWYAACAIIILFAGAYAFLLIWNVASTPSTAPKP
jgi:hypothetical protein